MSLGETLPDENICLYTAGTETKKLIHQLIKYLQLENKHADVHSHQAVYFNLVEKGLF
jgi:hypothetical protein